MKKIIIPFLVFTLFCSIVIAAGPKDSETKGTQNNNGNTEDSEKGQEEDQQVQTEQQTQTEEKEKNQQGQGGQTFILENQKKATTLDEVREMAQQRKKEMNQEIEGLDEIQRKVYQNQNQVREAVHVLLAIEDLAIGIGPQISKIAREFNNSIGETIIAEEKTQKRNSFIRFFMGGDKDAAEDIEQELNQNQQRIQNLRQLEEECDCEEEIKAVIQEQVQTIEQEQTRLQQLVDNEQSSVGVFGWVKNLFRWGR